MSALSIPQLALLRLKSLVGDSAADSLRARFAKGAFWSLTGALVSQGLGLAASIITARLLGREVFGELGMIQSTVGMFGVFAGMGLGLTATKHVAEFRITDPARAGRIIALSSATAMVTAGIVSLLLVVLAPFLASRTINAPHLTLELRMAAGLLFLNAVNGAQTGALAGFEAFRTIARVNLIRGVATFPITVVCVVAWGLPGAVLALVLAAGVACYMSRLAIRHQCSILQVSITWSSGWLERSVLWRFSLPAFLSSAMVGPVTWLANTMLVNQTNGYSEMALLNAANQWRMAISFLPIVLSQPLLSALSNMGATSDSEAFRRMLFIHIFINLSISGLAALLVVLCSPWIMAAYGPTFSAGTRVLVLLSFATVISATASVVGQAIASLGKMWWGFLLNSIWALVLVVVTHATVQEHGAAGVGVAMCISYLVHAFGIMLYASRLLRRVPACRCS